jgi:alanine dehydrogenase
MTRMRGCCHGVLIGITEGCVEIEERYMKTLVLTKKDIELFITMKDTIRVVREAYISFSAHMVTQPPIMCIDVPENNGEIDVKGGYSSGEGVIAVKCATAFFDNPKNYNIPSGLGIICLFDAKTGHALSLMDGCLATAFRTGAAGGVSSQVLARADSQTVGVIGAGEEARMQVRAIAEVLPIKTVKVWSIAPDELPQYKQDLEALLPVRVIPCNSAEEVVRESDIVVTTTPSRKAIVMADWVAPGTHIVALGADMPGKNELDPQLFARAKVVVDSVSQCVAQGETQNPIKAGVIKESDIHGEIGAVLSGIRPGRENNSEIIIFDSTGMAAQDVHTASMVYKKAVELGIGQWVELI